MSNASPQSAADVAGNGRPFSLANHFLIAMPGMTDPSFSGSVVYICDHDDEGALGLVINRSLELDLQDLFKRVDLELAIGELANQRVLFGGPVQTDRGFVLHDDVGRQYDSTLAVGSGLALTMSKDVLQAVANGLGPKRILVTLGHAGWAAGQLEREISANAWLTVEADASIVFDVPPAERFSAAMQRLGVDPAMLSDQAGHA